MRFFRDLESALATVRRAYDSGHYQSDPLAEEQIRRRLAGIDDERRHPNADGSLNLKVVGVLASDLLASAGPFEQEGQGREVVAAVSEAVDAELDAEETPRRVLEAVSRFGPLPPDTSRGLGWLPDATDAGTAVSIGTGVAAIVSQLGALSSTAAALVSLALITVAYTWRRLE